MIDRQALARHNDAKLTKATPMTLDETLDCAGLLCPLPVLKARKRLLQMQAGDVLSVRATDAMAAVDLPHFCAEAGHSLIETKTDGAVRIYRIRRGPGKL